MPSKPLTVSGLGEDPQTTNTNVASCLVWQRNSRQDKDFLVEGSGGSGGNRFLPPKAELGKSKTRNYVHTQNGANVQTDDGGKVIEALRGWPDGRQHSLDDELPSGRESVQGGFYNPEIYDDPALVEMFNDVRIGHKGASARSARASRSGKGKNKQKKGEDEEEMLDAPMGELIAHKYMREAQEREAARKLAEEQAKREQVRQRLSARKNRTSQLRQIAIDNKVLAVEKNPKELWKLSKFQDVPAHLQTFKNGRKAQKDVSFNLQDQELQISGRRSNEQSPIVQRNFSRLSDTVHQDGGPPRYGNSPDVTNAAAGYNRVSSGHDDANCYVEHYDNLYKRDADLFDPELP